MDGYHGSVSLVVIKLVYTLCLLHLFLFLFLFLFLLLLLLYTFVFTVMCGGHFLCAADSYSGQTYEHRHEWVEERLLFLSSIFSIISAATEYVLIIPIK